MLREFSTSPLASARLCTRPLRSAPVHVSTTRSDSLLPSCTHAPQNHLLHSRVTLLLTPEHTYHGPKLGLGCCFLPPFAAGARKFSVSFSMFGRRPDKWQKSSIISRADSVHTATVQVLSDSVFCTGPVALGPTRVTTNVEEQQLQEQKRNCKSID